MGSNIIVGIATTKFIGVVVLGFASSEMFRIYYFRMYMAIIFLGVFQGLMFLPSILFYIGPLTKGRTPESFIHDDDENDKSENEGFDNQNKKQNSYENQPTVTKRNQ